MIPFFLFSSFPSSFLYSTSLFLFFCVERNNMSVFTCVCVGGDIFLANFSWGRGFEDSYSLAFVFICIRMMKSSPLKSFKVLGIRCEVLQNSFSAKSCPSEHDWRIVFEFTRFCRSLRRRSSPETPLVIRTWTHGLMENVCVLSLCCCVILLTVG